MRDSHGRKLSVGDYIRVDWLRDDAEYSKIFVDSTGHQVFGLGPNECYGYDLIYVLSLGKIKITKITEEDYVFHLMKGDVII